MTATASGAADGATAGSPNRQPLDDQLVVQAQLGNGTFSLDVDFTAAAGSTVALLGPNGAGKSTTVAAVAGLVDPERAFIASPTQVLTDTANGVNLPAEARRVGVVFPDGLLFDHLSAEANVAFALRHAAGAHRSSRHALRAEAQGWLARIGAEHLADRRPSTLSSGEAQRVALARALASQPDVLLLDEPLARIDQSARTSLRRTLAAVLADLAAPRLLITHDATEAFLLADRVLVMEGGRITQQGTPDEIRRRPLTPYAADLSGVNLLRGVAEAGNVQLAEPAWELVSADTAASGPVLVTVHPRAATIHAERPTGSPRNVWQATLEAVEPLGDVTRLVLASPVPLRVDITPGAASELAVQPGGQVWVAVKATEVALEPEATASSP